eukprot:Gb_24794 [translate_table: standard]
MHLQVVVHRVLGYYSQDLIEFNDLIPYSSYDKSNILNCKQLPYDLGCNAITVKYVKVGKGRAPLHQGLLKLLYEYEKDKKSLAADPSRGGFSRLSGTHGEDTPLVGSKEGGARKRKPPLQILTASLAKCSRRSSRLQKKTIDKAKVVDFVESSEEDHNDSDVGKNTERGCSINEVGTSPSDKGPTKDPDGTQNLVEELKCHLKVLHGLGGSLYSTCVCINLLTLEITNYLKAVVSNLEDLSSAKNQQ